MRFFNKRWTKWVPFGNYCHTPDEYMVFVKKNKVTGMMKFKTVRINSAYRFKNQFVPKLIDVSEAWETIKNM